MAVTHDERHHVKTRQTLPLIVGIPGPSLNPEEMKILEELRPSGVILFSRNIVDVSQVRELTKSLKELEPRPYLSVDLEGGSVNRLSAIWGELPSASEAAMVGNRALRVLGEAAGAACRHLGIHQNLAPVVDLECPGALLAEQGRTMGPEVELVLEKARAFHSGLDRWCVGGCLKHFPGLGALEIDTHKDLPGLELSPQDLAEHMRLFEELSREIPVIMVGHVLVPAFGEKEGPASLSPVLVRKALDLPGSPVVLSDDLEMGALSGFGNLPDRVIAALRAHHHGVLVCSAFDKLEEIGLRLREEADGDALFAARLVHDVSRLGTMGHGLIRRFESIPAPDEATVAQLWEQARSGGR